MPQATPYIHTIDIRFADTDTEGHVYSGSYFVYCDEALMGLLAAAGYSWKQLASQGLAVYYVEARCQFKHPARFGDRLLVQTTINKLGDTSFHSKMRIVAEDGGQLIANGYIAAVMVDKAAEKPVSIPENIKQAVRQFQSTD
jgi:acyl-CoA thioester hydrolase